jgi:hypothetical protein
MSSRSIEKTASGTLCIIGESVLLNAHGEFLQLVFRDCRRQGANLDFKLVSVPEQPSDAKSLEEVRKTIMQCDGVVVLFEVSREAFTRIEHFAHWLGNTLPSPLMMVGMRSIADDLIPGSEAEEIALARAYAAQILGCPMVSFQPILPSSSSSSSSSSFSSSSGKPVHRRTNAMASSQHVLHASLMLRGFMCHANKIKDPKVLAKCRFVRFSSDPSSFKVLKSEMKKCHWNEDTLFEPEEDLVFELVREGAKPIGCFLSFHFEFDFKDAERVTPRLQEVVEATRVLGKKEKVTTLHTRSMTQAAPKWMEVNLSISRAERRKEYSIKEAGPVNYMKSDSFTVFAIEVEAPGHKGIDWTVFKRYSDLLAWKDKLKLLFPKQARTFAKFPGKKWFSHSQAFIEGRRMLLERFLESLLLIEPVWKSQVFQSFFETFMHSPSVKSDKTMRFTQDMLAALHEEIRNRDAADGDHISRIPQAIPENSLASPPSTSPSPSSPPSYTAVTNSSAVTQLEQKRRSYAKTERRPTLRKTLVKKTDGQVLNDGKCTLKVQPLYKDVYANTGDMKNRTLGVMWGQGMDLERLQHELTVLERCRVEEMRDLAICYGKKRSELEEMILGAKIRDSQ